MNPLTRRALIVILTINVGVSFAAFAADRLGHANLTREERAWLRENPDKLVLWLMSSSPP